MTNQRKLSVMLRAVLKLLCVALALSAPTIASAQINKKEGAAETMVKFFYAMNVARTEQFIPFQYRRNQEQKEAFYIANRFARCAVQLNEEMAFALLDAAMTEDGVTIEEEQKYYNRLKGCAIKRAYVDREFMRGSLAVHLMLRNEQYENIDAVKSADELMAYLKSLEVASRNFGHELTSMQIGFECRAAIVPWAAYDVIAEEPETEDEQFALNRLKKLTPLCDQFFPDEELSSWFQRSFLARGLYHWNQFREANPVPIRQSAG